MYTVYIYTCTCMYTLYMYIVSSDLDYSSLVWGDEVLTLLCPPAGEEPHLALPELIQKACYINLCMQYHVN